MTSLRTLTRELPHRAEKIRRRDFLDKELRSFCDDVKAVSNETAALLSLVQCLGEEAVAVLERIDPEPPVLAKLERLMRTTEK